MVTLLSPADGYLFDTHTEMQNEFIKRIKEDGIDSALRWLEPVKNNKEQSYPAPLTFTWVTDTSDASVLEIAKTENFANPMVFRTNSDSCMVWNLEIGQKYFWRVNGGEVRSFETLGHAPRFIKIDGLLNVRDLGGNAIRQGMVYRGCELERTFAITEAGKHTFVHELGIKTELDLRGDCFGLISSSAAGEEVVLKQLPYRPYKEIFEEQHKKGICRIMEFLADERRYPLFIHCLGGADRTGMIAIFLRALLGESDESIHTDYELTALSMYEAGVTEGANGFRSRNSDYYAEFLAMLDPYAPAKPLSEQVRAFLLHCGVTTACMDKIAAILKK